jgi:hypothetical protein
LLLNTLWQVDVEQGLAHARVLFYRLPGKPSSSS